MCPLPVSPAALRGTRNAWWSLVVLTYFGGVCETAGPLSSFPRRPPVLGSGPPVYDECGDGIICGQAIWCEDHPLKFGQVMLLKSHFYLEHSG